jgi:F-type H+-transporting ATPase subunit b
MPHLEVQYFLTQIFWLGVFFFALYAFNSLFLLPFLRGKSRKRQKIITQNLEAAEVLLNESKMLKKEIDGIVAEVRDEARAIRSDAAKKAQDMVEKQVNASHKTFHNYLAKSQEEEQKQLEQLEQKLPAIVNDIKKDLMVTLTRSSSS